MIGRAGWVVWTWIAAASCTFDPAPHDACHADADCPEGACRDGVCIDFSTPLDEPFDPTDPPDAGDGAP